MSDIQDEAYTELCLENEGLRKALSIAHAEYGKVDKKLEDALGRIAEQLKLITRAADALEKLNRCFLVEDASVDWELIAQLRKAAPSEMRAEKEPATTQPRACDKF